MPLVEVVKGERSSQEMAERVHTLLTRCGKTPVLVQKGHSRPVG